MRGRWGNWSLPELDADGAALRGGVGSHGERRKSYARLKKIGLEVWENLCSVCLYKYVFGIKLGLK